MTLAFLTGLLICRRVAPDTLAAYVSLLLLINSKQTFVPLFKGRTGWGSRVFLVLALQVVVAAVLLALSLGRQTAALLPYVFLPVLYLISLKMLGEHNIMTELSGFATLSAASVVSVLTVSGDADIRVFIAVAVFFMAGVLKVRVQLRRGMSNRLTMAFYVLVSLVVFKLIHAPLVALLPLSENLWFSLAPYRSTVKTTGRVEALKGIVFVILMGLAGR